MDQNTTVFTFANIFAVMDQQLVSFLLNITNNSYHPYQACIDIDECALLTGGSSVCHNGVCKNVRGSFQCDCYEGEISLYY